MINSASEYELDFLKSPFFSESSGAEKSVFFGVQWGGKVRFFRSPVGRKTDVSSRLRRSCRSCCSSTCDYVARFEEHKKTTWGKSKYEPDVLNTFLRNTGFKNSKFNKEL